MTPTSIPGGLPATAKSFGCLSKLVAVPRPGYLPDDICLDYGDSIAGQDPEQATWVVNRIIDVRPTEPAHWQFRMRIMTLAGYLEDEGTPLNRASERDFWDFIRPFHRLSRGSLFGLESGNLSAEWGGRLIGKVSLEFLGDRTIRYFLITGSLAGARHTKNYEDGIETFDGTLRKIQAHNLHWILQS